MQKVYERINWENDPSTNTPINEDNLNKMDYTLDVIDNRIIRLAGYEERAKTSEENALEYANQAATSETNAKTYMESASASEESARASAEQAMSGTPDGYAALVEQVDLLDIATTTDRTLNNSKAGGLRLLELQGYTEQRTIPGNQLLDIKEFLNDISSCACTVNGDSVTLVGVGASNYEYVRFEFDVSDKVGETIYLKYTKVSESLGTSAMIMLNFLDSAGTSVYRYTGSTTIGDYSGNCVIPEGAVRCRVVVYANQGTALADNTVVYKDIMISYADVPHEPYCGDIPSPNPAYPQAIMNTGDCVEMINGVYQSSSGNYIKDTSNTYICSKNRIPCKSGDIVTIKAEADLNQVFLAYYNGSTYVSYKDISLVQDEYSFTIPSGVTHFNVNLRNTNGLTIDTVGKITLTINGKYVTQFVEYGVDELANVSAVTGYLDSNGAVVTDSGWYHKIVEIDNSYNYFLTNGTIGNKPKHCWFDYNMNFITYVSTNLTEILLIPPSNAKYLGVSFVSILSNTQVQKQKVATFLTNEPLRAGDVLYKDSDGLFKVERNSKVITLDTLSFNTYANYGKTHYAKIKDKKIGYQVSKCTHFTNKDTSWSKEENVGHYSDHGTSTLTFFNTEFSALDEFTTWLEENKPIYEYLLATPTIEVLETESQIALNSLETFDTVTYIEVDSRVQPSGIEVEYGTSQVGAESIGNANNLELHKIQTQEQFNALGITYLEGVSLGDYATELKAFCRGCTDIPTSDEFDTPGFLEVFEFNDGFEAHNFVMQRYTLCSIYMSGTYQRFKSKDSSQVWSDWALQ